MQREGPALELLLRRLAETPDDFLAEPSIGGAGTVEVRAVVGDLLRLLGGKPDADALEAFLGTQPQRDRNRLMVVLLICWLLADEWFQQSAVAPDAVLRVLREDAADMGRLTAAKKFVTDPERREELARVVLARIGCRPSGESVAQAQDRLMTLSSTERARVLHASQAAMRRAREIRAALARKAAEESADKYTRE
jgi:hypothetical protein